MALPLPDWASSAMRTLGRFRPHDTAHAGLGIHSQTGALPMARLRSLASQLVGRWAPWAAQHAPRIDRINQAADGWAERPRPRPWREHVDMAARENQTDRGISLQSMRWIVTSVAISRSSPYRRPIVTWPASSGYSSKLRRAAQINPGSSARCTTSTRQALMTVSWMSDEEGASMRASRALRPPSSC